MAKTKTVKRKAWGVLDKDGGLCWQANQPIIRHLKRDAEWYVRPMNHETVRPVTISWEVEDYKPPTHRRAGARRSDEVTVKIGAWEV